MYYKFNYLFYTIILLINIKFLKTLNINFHYNYNLQIEPFNTQIYKRELAQFFDKASFAFNGFQKVESIPIPFPIDICLLSLEGYKHAAALHTNKNGARHFKILKMNNGTYDIIADIAMPNAIAMDCITFNNKGYVALALNITEPIQFAKDGSAIYEIAGNRIKAVQYFSTSNLTSIYLHASGNELFLLHTYASTQDLNNHYCPYFKWSGSTFNKIGRIHCSNARQLLPFSIDYESYVAVANYADQKGRTSTYSEIYKYSREMRKFVLFQKIRTNGAVDVQYFNIPTNEINKQHFLVFGNSISEGNNFDADSLFYLFDRSEFIPYQKLSLYAVKKILPVQNLDADKFLLLVACTDQDIKVYNFKDFKFEECKVQFTDGALGTGVSNLRIYQEYDKSYLIIANKRMSDNETNIYLPIFKQEQHTNGLRQNIIDWAKAETQRLNAVDIKDVGKQVEEKLKSLQQMKYFLNMRDIQQANIQTVTTERLVYPKLKMSSDYWLTLSYVDQALDALEIIIKQKQRLKRDTVSSFASFENVEYVYDTLNVKNFKVHRYLRATKVNKVHASKPELENINAKRVIVNDKYAKPLRERVNSTDNMEYKDEKDIMLLKNLQINGKLNEYLWTDLFNNTLKRQGDIQFLKAPIEIGVLKTDNMIVKNDQVNEQDLGALISISGGKYVINQDIQFATPVTVNNLNISERLNNLHVSNGQFDVLLKKSNKTQVIKGLKNITNIKVMEPVTITGKMKGQQLEAISPNKSIHESLVLQGNFVIKGDVYINHQLNTLDLINLHEKLSTKQVLDMGIRMDQSLNDINLKFQQSLTANNSLVSFINQHDLQKLVKLNQDDIQLIEGLKVFPNSLVIKSGFSEVKYLNGIDIEKLEDNAFLINNNQTVKVPMKIGKVSAQSIQSSTMLLNNKNLSDYLTITSNQSIEGTLILENLKVKFLTVEQLNTDNKIFGQIPQNIYQQKSRNAPQEDVFKEHQKFHGSIYVQNLVLNSTINNKPVEIIESQISQLEGNIKYVGNFKFNYPINVTNMTFEGKLNGISSENFGKCWLEKKAEKQIFTASQTFAAINAKEGILLRDKLNGFTMEEFHTKTYWINGSEYISCANFANPFVITAYLTTKTLNDYMMSHDVFYRTAKGKPNVINSMTVNGNLLVGGSIINLSSINKIKLEELQDFLDGTTLSTLYVENVNFSNTPPLYKTLNHKNIRETLDSAWLTNDNVILPYRVEITNAIFEGLLEFEGHINGINLDYLKGNYFSKTQPQNITVEMTLRNDAKFEKDILSNDLQIFGAFTEGKSGIPFNFNEFVQNTVKTSGPHIISGNWSLPVAILDGNLNNVLINQLNLVNDIFHDIKQATAYIFKAPKIFKNLHIQNLYADPSSLINRVPVCSWIREAVYLYENYTIKGATTIDSINVYNNLIVFGKVNNITFNERNLLLQNNDQTILGSVKIISHLPQEERFLTNNIEHLHTDYINRQYMPTFVENLIPAVGTTEIIGNLTFKHALAVENYEGPEGVFETNQWSKRNIQQHVPLGRQAVYKTGDMLEESENPSSNLFHVNKNDIYKLDHFDIIQTIETRPAELFIFSLETDTGIVDILAVSEMQTENVNFFKWIPNDEQFRKTNEFDWLPHDNAQLKIIHKQFLLFHEPIKVQLLKSYINKDLGIFLNVLSRVTNFHTYFEFLNRSCMLFQSSIIKDYFELRIFCLKSQYSQKRISCSQKVQQVKKFGNKYVALLTNSSILIYDIGSTSNKILQNIPLTEPKQMALGSFKNYKFLAVFTSRNHGFIKIYRSVNSSDFTLLQILNCTKPAHIAFSVIEKSNDFLIHVLTDSLTKPYLIYRYNGIMGFMEILSSSLLQSTYIDFDILNLYSSTHYLVALKGQYNIALINFALNKI